MIRPEHVIAAVKAYIEDVSLEGAFGAAPGWSFIKYLCISFVIY
jgi:hypothetical protein